MTIKQKPISLAPGLGAEKVTAPVASVVKADEVKLATEPQRASALRALDYLKRSYTVGSSRLARSLGIGITSDLKTILVRKRELPLSLLLSIAGTLDLSLDEFLAIERVSQDNQRAQQLIQLVKDKGLFEPKRRARKPAL